MTTAMLTTAPITADWRDFLALTKQIGRAHV